MRQRNDRKISSRWETIKNRLLPAPETVEVTPPPALTGEYPRRLAQKVSDVFIPDKDEVVVMPFSTIIPWGAGYVATVEASVPVIVPRDVALNAEANGQAKIVNRPEATRPRMFGRVAQ